MKAQQRFNKLLSNSLTDYMAWCYRMNDRLKKFKWGEFQIFEYIQTDRQTVKNRAVVPTLEGFADWLEQTNDKEISNA